VGIGDDLESGRAERCVQIVRPLDDLFLAARDGAQDRMQINWRRKVVDHGVEKRLHSDVFA
jgi:hypothetical protein